MIEEGEAAIARRPVGGTSRRRGREVALQVLYAIDLAADRPRRNRDEPDGIGANPDPAAADGSQKESGQAADPIRWLADDLAPIAESDADRVFDVIATHFEMPDGSREFARELAVSVRGRIAQIDAAIVRHARNWRLVRMAVVDRNILRIGSYELEFTDTPVAVVLNEAVDLARRFGSDASPAFVNGILDAIAHDVRRTAS